MKKRIIRTVSLVMVFLLMTMVVSAEEIIVPNHISSPYFLIDLPEEEAELREARGYYPAQMPCYECGLQTVGTLSCSGLEVNKLYYRCSEPTHDLNGDGYIECMIIVYVYGDFFTCANCRRGYACAGGTYLKVNGQPDFRYPNDPYPDEEYQLPTSPNHNEYFHHNPATAVNGVYCKYQTPDQLNENIPEAPTE